MADLKAGTTIGGTLVWTQGNFPLFPTGNTLLYKTFKVYSENDKPQAVDNDFVSKAAGGTYTGEINVNGKLTIYALGKDWNSHGGQIQSGNGDSASFDMCNLDIASWQGLGFIDKTSGIRYAYINTRTGSFETKGSIGVGQNVSISLAPSNASHATRKDYVDSLINNVTTNANDRVSKGGDTMRGNLTVPKVFITSAATQDDQVPWLAQVVQRGVVLDYGTF